MLTLQAWPCGPGELTQHHSPRRWEAASNAFKTPRVKAGRAVELTNAHVQQRPVTPEDYGSTEARTFPSAYFFSSPART